METQSGKVARFRRLSEQAQEIEDAKKAAKAAEPTLKPVTAGTDADEGMPVIASTEQAPPTPAPKPQPPTQTETSRRQILKSHAKKKTAKKDPAIPA